MKPRLIDANALKENGTVIAIVNGEKMKVVPIKCIDNTPTVERPTGNWKGRRYYRPSTNQYDCEMSICSECGEEYSYDAETGISITDYSFCPKCGTSMKKGGFV